MDAMGRVGQSRGLDNGCSPFGRIRSLQPLAVGLMNTSLIRGCVLLPTCWAHASLSGLANRGLSDTPADLPLPAVTLPVRVCLLAALFSSCFFLGASTRHLYSASLAA
jgi:hypothetical protein